MLWSLSMLSVWTSHSRSTSKHGWSSLSSQISADVGKQNLCSLVFTRENILTRVRNPHLDTHTHTHTSHVHKCLIHKHISGDGDYSSTLLIITKSVDASGTFSSCVRVSTPKVQHGAMKTSLTRSVLLSCTRASSLNHLNTWHVCIWQSVVFRI